MITEQERFEQFMAIIRRGGTVVMHPDTWEEMKAMAPARFYGEEIFPLMVSNRVMANEYVKPGQILAVEKREFKFENFNFTRIQ